MSIGMTSSRIFYNPFLFARGSYRVYGDSVTFVESITYCQPRSSRYEKCRLAQFSNISNLELSLSWRTNFGQAWIGAIVIGNTNEVTFLNGNSILSMNGSGSGQILNQNAPCRAITVTGSYVNSSGVFVKSKWFDSLCNDRHSVVCECVDKKEDFEDYDDHGYRQFNDLDVEFEQEIEEFDWQNLVALLLFTYVAFLGLLSIGLYRHRHLVEDKLVQVFITTDMKMNLIERDQV